MVASSPKFRQFLAVLSSQLVRLAKAPTRCICQHSVAQCNNLVHNKVMIHEGHKLEISRILAAIRRERRLTQIRLASRCGLTRQEISYFETGSRAPSLEQLLRIASALDLPLQRFLSGHDRPGSDVRAIALELRALGLVDIHVEDPLVPGAFRRPEEIVALAIAGEEPETRIVEGIPAILAWNHWSGPLLRAFAAITKPKTIHRLAWLADIVLALDKAGGFPGGCSAKEDLAAFLKGVKQPPTDRWDDLGAPASQPPTSTIYKRWRINYAADLGVFRQRAEKLVELRLINPSA
jgi:transcriptional regulator with XRE-family HTH domain